MHKKCKEQDCRNAVHVGVYCDDHQPNCSAEPLAKPTTAPHRPSDASSSAPTPQAAAELVDYLRDAAKAMGAKGFSVWQQFVVIAADQIEELARGASRPVAVPPLTDSLQLATEALTKISQMDENYGHGLRSACFTAEKALKALRSRTVPAQPKTDGEQG